jgi:hypothetical protein
MNKIYYLLLAHTLFVAIGVSQQIHGTCGTTNEENLAIKQRMLANREEWKDKLMQRGVDTAYVPVNFHIAAKSDGTGRLPLKNVIDNLCCLNEIYSEFGIRFYLRQVRNLTNPEGSSYIYDDPSSNISKEYIKLITRDYKNAINIIVGNIANASEPNVLAFYSPQGDYVVSNKAYVNSNCEEIAHELGHYFSLAHTFFGWESTVHDCTKPTPLTVNGVLVEFVDRNKPGTIPGKKHCEQAADGFCGTQADYNLGLGHSGCVYDGCAKDPDGVKLDPDERNFMSYFLDCLQHFSDDQEEAIIKDLLSSGRDYLRSAPYLPKPEITGQMVYLTPTSGSPPKGYDIIFFDWEDVPNAQYYIFEVAENLGFTLNARQFILTHSDTTLTGFKKNFNHYWRVKPYNSNSFCLVPNVITFRTPSWTVASEDIENTNISSYVFENNQSESTLVIHSLHSIQISVQVINSNGQIVESQSLRLVNGDNRVKLGGLLPGFYMYRIIDEEKKANTAKFIKS